MRALMQLVFIAILSAIQASFIQFYGFIPIKYAFFAGYAPTLFIANAAFAFCCFAWNRSLAIICICLQCFLSLFLCTYVGIFGAQPTLVGLVNGVDAVKQMDTGIGPYIDGTLVLIFGALCCIMIMLRLHSKELSTKQRVICAVCALCIFGTLHYGNHTNKSYLLLSPEYFQKALKSNRIHSMRETYARRGYLMSTVIQIATGTLSQKQLPLTEGTCSSTKAVNTPVPYLGKRVVLLQVESLGWELLHLQVKGHEVMPFISSLAKNSTVLKLDGLKKQGSANSDYELLNAKEVLEDRIYYGSITQYPDSLLTQAQKQGYDIAIVHGLTGEYMDRRLAYSLMGKPKQYFTEELRNEGYTLHKPFGGLILDDDLLEYSNKILHGLSTPALLFAITISMHEPALVPLVQEFDSSANSAFYSACAHTDAAIKKFVAAAPDDTTFIIYGDHSPYWGSKSGFVPLLIYTKHDVAQKTYSSDSVFSRCEAGHYLRQLLGFSPLADQAQSCAAEISPQNAATKNSPKPAQ